MKPLLKLSKTAKHYWPILMAQSTAVWSDTDNLLASQMCRDLGLLEELACNAAGGALMAEICRRVHVGSQLLKLDGNPAGNTAQHKIVQTIFAGV